MLQEPDHFPRISPGKITALKGQHQNTQLAYFAQHYSAFLRCSAGKTANCGETVFPISGKMRLFHLFGVIRLCQMFFPVETWVSHGGEVEVNFKTLWCSRIFPQLWDVAALGVVRGAWSTLVLLRWLVDVKYSTWSNAAYYGNNPCMKNHRAAVSFILFTLPILLFSFFSGVFTPYS